ncbi:acyl carrier protein [Candidatus Soleaferrea massiliensis]|uniref:acyl carrier protein n=1 Tax=Candidatus Soleaferrea massiliensis TaxID=1470354 RepID=UPI00058D52DF|nr:acyl carrier protein [Candidatus Soleaferrea massiliensis]
MIRDALIQKISKKALIPGLVTQESNLYTDLGFDSLSFITLLAEIEGEYGISFDITEMEDCLIAGRLISFVESKTKER